MQRVGQFEGVVAWLGVQVGQGFGERAEQGSDPVGVGEPVARVHRFDVEGLVVAVHPDGLVEQVGGGLRVNVGSGTSWLVGWSQAPIG